MPTVWHGIIYTCAVIGAVCVASFGFMVGWLHFGVRRVRRDRDRELLVFRRVTVADLDDEATERLLRDVL